VNKRNNFSIKAKVLVVETNIWRAKEGLGFHLSRLNSIIFCFQWLEYVSKNAVKLHKVRNGVFYFLAKNVDQSILKL